MNTLLLFALIRIGCATPLLGPDADGEKLPRSRTADGAPASRMARGGGGNKPWNPQKNVWSRLRTADEECKNGETKWEDCNTCTCWDGLWACTYEKCNEINRGQRSEPECKSNEMGGESKMIDCNTCNCIGGNWMCTMKICLEKQAEPVANPTEYVMVTSEDGTAYASSELSTEFKADKAFGEDGYWCSVQSPERPVRLWFEFKEPKRVVQIKFEEEYEMSDVGRLEDWTVFGSNAVGDCGNNNKPRRILTQAPASVFVTGKEFRNRRLYRCYGIQTMRYGRSNYVSAKKLKFGFGRQDPVPHICDEPNGCSHTCRKMGRRAKCRCPRGWRLIRDRRTCRKIFLEEGMTSHL